MTPNDPDLRAAIDTLRASDRPDGVDREAMLRALLADVATAAPPAVRKGLSLRHALTGALGLAALALLIVATQRSPTPARSHRPTTTVTAPAAPVAHTLAAPAPSPVEAPSAPVVAPSAPVASPSVAPVVARARAARVLAPNAEAAAHDDEWRIIREADEALRASQPDRALAILARHTRGVAGPEVLAYRVRAYCMAGRTREALAVAEALRAQAPGSPAAYSLRATCAAPR